MAFKKLRRRYFLACTLAFLSATAGSLSIASAETLGPVVTTSFETGRDVDLTFVDEALIALVWSDGGWRTVEIRPDAMQETRCRFSGRAWLSYDKKVVITSSGGATPTLSAMHPRRCELIASVETNAWVRDADFHVGTLRFGYAERTADGLFLELRGADGTSIARLGRVRNAELGFSPDGSALINFDHGGGTTQAWLARNGKKAKRDDLNAVDLHFSPDGRLAFLTTPGVVQAFEWSALSQTAKRSIPIASDEVLRGTSSRGNTLVVQAPNVHSPAAPFVRLYDTMRSATIPLGSGHIDAVALAANGDQTAIAIRDARRNVVRVTLSRAQGLFTP